MTAHPPGMVANQDFSEAGSEAISNTPAPNYAEQNDARLFAAERLLKERLGKEPGNPVYYLELADIYTALFDRTRKQKGKQSSSWLWKSGDALEKAVMLDPANQIARYNLGVVYKRQGQRERAREELKKLIRTSDPMRDAPILFSAWMEIGSIYAEQGFWDEAEESYVKAREYDYGNLDVQEALQMIQEKRREDREGSSKSSGISSFGMNSAAMLPAADPSQNIPQNQNIGQALPYLGQMIAQKFSGEGNDQGAGEQ